MSTGSQRLLPRKRPSPRQHRFNSNLRWFVLSIAVGVVAGLGAVFFFELSDRLSHLFMHWAGYAPVPPRGESGGAIPDPSDYETPVIVWWKLLLLLVTGGAVVGVLVQRFAPEAKGHGTDGAIEAFHRKRGEINPRVIWVKTVASAITLATGGSGGREGPIAQIGAGFGSFLGRALKLSPRERRMLLALGMGAGVGAIFRAPLAGALFAAEILYARSDFESEVILPSIIGCVISYEVFTGLQALIHQHSQQLTLFVTGPDLAFHQPLELIPYTVLALVLSGMVWVYARSFYGIEGLFERWRIRPWIKPALGALLTGLLALGLWRATGDGRSLNVLAFGYAVIQEAFDLQVPHGEAWALAGMMMLIAFGKILTTGLTIGSGGSAGVFGPSMVIGAAIGCAVGLVFTEIWPSLGVHPGAFAIVGMAGFFTGAASVPISTLIMVSEITGNYSLLVPVMWVETITFALTGRASIYRAQVPRRYDSPAHRGDFIVDVLEDLRVQDLRSKLRSPTLVKVGTSLRDIMRIIDESKSHYFPVVGPENRLVGIFSTNDVRRYLHDEMMWDLLVAADIMVSPVITLRLEDNLATAMRRFTTRNIDEVPVVQQDQPDRVLGMLGRREVIHSYNAEVEAGRRAQAEAQEGV